MNSININGHLIGSNFPCFIIAEAGVNHNGDINLAHKLIDEASAAGANAVKFQSFVTEELITRDAPKANYQIETTGKQGGQYAMLKALELTEEQHKELKIHCNEAGIIYVCTPYDYTSIDMLDRLEVPLYKVASTDTTNIPFLRYLASKNRPVILSTGMCTLGEVEMAVNALDTTDIAILQCTSEYPVPFSDVNLSAMKTMSLAFNRPVGFSDHTPGIGASPWAVAMGACIVEKHFTLDRMLEGPDHRASIEPDELKQLVQMVRDVEKAIGDGIKRPMPSEIRNKSKMQKSLVVKHPVKAGATITEADLIAKRPATGLPPSWLDRVVGKVARVDLHPDMILQLSDIEA